MVVALLRLMTEVRVWMAATAMETVGSWNNRSKRVARVRGWTYDTEARDEIEATQGTEARRNIEVSNETTCSSQPLNSSTWLSSSGPGIAVTRV
jgi:hypothetical protein